MTQPGLPTVPSDSSPEATRGEGATAAAPPLATAGDGLPGHLAGFPRVGEALGDFQLLRVLGAGSFACVYLAWQSSLGRRVALKAARSHGQEGQALARLQHPNIVTVYSTAEDAQRGLYLLAMQYIPGGTLEGLMAHLASLPPEARGGKAVLDFLDSKPGDAPTLDLAALREREMLARMGHVEMTCWYGARLAEALAHAHDLGILHRDIKPANVLIDRYGRPMLADFNVSSGAGGANIGGTLAYMAGEHLEAFLNNRAQGPGKEADLFSLGVLLFQLYTGHLPVEVEAGLPVRESVQRMIEARKRPAPPLSSHLPADPGLEGLVARCLEPEPEDRPASAGEVAAALDSARELHRARRELPEGGLLTRWAVHSPILFTLLLIPLVHVIASVVNISYNGLQIVRDLTPQQQRLFPLLVLMYNAVAWPVCLALFLRPVLRVFRAYGALKRPGLASDAEVARARREAMTLPGLLARYSCLGWLPGGVLFPLALSLAGPVGGWVYAKFALSFLMSGLIAVVYSVLLMELACLRALYPALWVYARGMRQVAREELSFEERRLGRLQMLAVLIPVAGAVLMVTAGPEELSREAYAAFRILVTALLGMGMLGLGLAVQVSAELRRVLSALTGEGR
jgi:serine/threonine protein kinase